MTLSEQQLEKEIKEKMRYCVECDDVFFKEFEGQIWCSPGCYAKHNKEKKK
jgi:hypothetical protein